MFLCTAFRCPMNPCAPSSCRTCNATRYELRYSSHWLVTVRNVFPFLLTRFWSDLSTTSSACAAFLIWSFLFFLHPISQQFIPSIPIANPSMLPFVGHTISCHRYVWDHDGPICFKYSTPLWSLNIPMHLPPSKIWLDCLAILFLCWQVLTKLFRQWPLKIELWSRLWPRLSFPKFGRWFK